MAPAFGMGIVEMMCAGLLTHKKQKASAKKENLKSEDFNQLPIFSWIKKKKCKLQNNFKS